MNIVFDSNDFKIESLYFLEKKKNVVIDGFFSKMVYSDEFFTMNGIFFSLPLIYQCDTNVFQNKQCIQFQSHLPVNLLCITKLSEIENGIINYYKKINSIKKRNNLVLTNQLYNGFFKIYKENYNTLKVQRNKKFMLKISGLWENRDEVGITYKFMEIYEMPAVMNTCL